jgi:xanthine dehydrogenase YagS FAD-binding subunit
VKFTLRKPVDFAVVSVACVIGLDNGICRDARIVLGAVASVPMRATGAEEAIKGKVIDETVASEAAEVALDDASPLSMNEYKIAITKALVKQALLKDVEQRQ